LQLVDGIVIDLKKIIEPKTENHLVVEGAGGVFVPLNDTDYVIDLIQMNIK
jgi:dethiobiotin synthetase